MPALTLLRAGSARRVPWRNGRGTTDEIAVLPAGTTFETGDFALRLSAARVDEPGPFSSFPGIDRTIVVTDGEGLDLVHDGAPAVRVPRMTPHAFSGDAATRAALVGGPVRDFNVMTRRGALHADVATTADVLVVAGPAERCFVHAVAGSVRVATDGGAASVEAADRDTVAAGPLADGERITVTARGAAAIVVSVRLV